MLDAFGKGDYATTVELLVNLRPKANRFGGSHAQRDLLERVVRTKPDYAQGRLTLGRFYQTETKHKDLDKALEHYEAYVRLEREDPETVRQIGRTIAALRAARTAK